MKNLSYIFLCIVLLSSCSKSGLVDDTGDVNTAPSGASNTTVTGLTYAQIEGQYRLYDSIYFEGNQAFQPIDDKFHTKISRVINVGIDRANASFKFNGQQYFETRSVVNEYMTDDPRFTWKKIRFFKDSIYVNFFIREYKSNDTCQNITIRGYKL